MRPDAVIVASTWQRVTDWCYHNQINPRAQIAIVNDRDIYRVQGIDLSLEDAPLVVFLDGTSWAYHYLLSRRWDGVNHAETFQDDRPRTTGAPLGA